jgi:hypothetical protein
MDIHHYARRGLAVYEWAEVPEELRATKEQAIAWMPEYHGEARQRRLLAVLDHPACRAAVRPNPWWDGPKPWVPCRNPTKGDWCARHFPLSPPVIRPAIRLRILVFMDDAMVADIDEMTEETRVERASPVYESGESDMMNTYRSTGWTHLRIDYLKQRGSI